MRCRAPLPFAREGPDAPEEIDPEQREQLRTPSYPEQREHLRAPGYPEPACDLEAPAEEP